MKIGGKNEEHEKKEREDCRGEPEKFESQGTNHGVSMAAALKAVDEARKDCRRV